MLIDFEGISPQIGAKTFVAPSASVIGDLVIGDEGSIWYGVVIRGDVNHIRIGNRSNIQDLSMLHVTHKSLKNPQGNPTIIGDDVTIGHMVMLHGCTIEDACLIGMKAVVLDGAIIGKESIVGAGSLVTKGKVFPPRSLIMGSPAKVVRALSDEEVASLYKSAKDYVTFKNKFMV
ncbi:MAG: gamma carbonic anhydrase family protein [Sulfurospirillum sp.]|nr:gamma carbonic anhydrase family protein [Sulfurospirillum sp.]